MNAWEALTVVLCWATFIVGVVALGAWAVLAAFQAHRDRLEFDAWRLQLPPPLAQHPRQAGGEGAAERLTH